MIDEKRIQELQHQINELALQLNDSRQRLLKLNEELKALKSGTPNIQENKSLETEAPVFTLENFIGFKLLHLVGIVVLVIGLSIGVKYAIDQQLISEVTRIILAYLAGGLLLFFSFRLKKKYTLFSAILLSGGMASIYFTTYGAFAYYHLLPLWISFLLMIAMTVYTSWSAIEYNRQEVAILGMIGAYGIPFLISANAEKAALLFAYIMLINIGVLFVSFYKRWKLMGQLAMLITWILFIGWLMIRYNSGQALVASFFMVVFFMQFIVNALGFHVSRKQPLTVFDIEMVIANNIALYISLLFIAGSGTMALKLNTVTGLYTLFIAGLAVLGYYFLSAEKKLFNSLVIQCLVFLILFVAFQWDGISVTLLWLAIAISLFAWGLMQRISWPRMASIILMGVTLLKLIALDSVSFSTIEKIICYIIIGALLLIISFFYQKFKDKMFGEK